MFARELKPTTASGNTQKSSPESFSENPEMQRTAIAMAAKNLGSRIEKQPFGTFLVVKGSPEPGGRAGVEKIGEAEYTKLIKTWRALQDGSGKVHFDPGLTAWQRAKLLEAFATLLGRGPVGRQLVMFAVWDGAPMLIQAGRGSTKRVDQVNKATSELGLGTTGPLQQVTVPIYRDEKPFYETIDHNWEEFSLSQHLGHELAHGTVAGNEVWKGYRDSQYEYREERRVIVGFENALHQEDQTPFRGSHDARFELTLPLTEKDGELLRSTPDVTVLNSSPLRVLHEKLVSLAKNPEISPSGRQMCAGAATQLLARSNFEELRADFVKQHGRHLAMAYKGLGQTMPNFLRMSLNEFKQELANLRVSLMTSVAPQELKKFPPWESVQAWSITPAAIVGTLRK